ncbi:FAD-binding protein [Actomonas aquatica]|uniref:UDP-N-acetylenolpyruvoylglucosamine reductase n=1 Tax=Actomonas aquatica TaxID=2866162 RepID=A0ABZ1CA76_9BACT|nr:FAD-binding protein [Opitutus sp. WL0086]WRQ88588.1 FAD-binding protein [Opitutus sp. WL0086]
MKIERENLSEYTTIKIGGVASLWKPDSIDEFKNGYEKIQREGMSFRVLGNGSNIIASGNGISDLVVFMGGVSNLIENLGGGYVKVGASVRLQKLIRYLAKSGLGGISDLFSVPATVGGAILMNAGCGSVRGFTDFVETVIVHDGVKLHELSRSDLEAAYRFTKLQHLGNCIVLGAVLRLRECEKATVDSEIRHRLSVVAKRPYQYPNCGSLFKYSNRWVMKLFDGYKSGGLYFKNGTLCNRGGAEFDDAIKFIERIKRIHKVFGLRCKEEVKIWR